MNNIRNFCIISHIDHGKSTLADRFLELTQSIEKREMKEQFLDMMDLEREKGITIKLQPVRMKYQKDKTEYLLNLIDTPGHVDFTYEVSRSLAAVEGAILLVDASQGVQAQTLTNLHLAQQAGLVIMPVVNKIDLPTAKIEEVITEISQLVDLEKNKVMKISAKQGTGVEDVISEIIKRVPPPAIKVKAPARALIFDSVYDKYKGIIAYARVIDGCLKKGDEILMIASGAKAEIIEIGTFRPRLTKSEFLQAGEIGYLATGLKEIDKCRVGDTITLSKAIVNPLPGYKEPQPVVFAGFYPIESNDYPLLKDSLSKLKLSDASLEYQAEFSQGLGRGFRCGFLGMLHLEIIFQRLKREYGLNLLISSPSVIYQVILSKNKSSLKSIKTTASKMPDPSQIKEIQEPWVKLKIMTPLAFLGQVMKLLSQKRGRWQKTDYLSQEKVLIVYQIPLDEIIANFYDSLKNVTSGYGSLSWQWLGYQKEDLLRMDILVAGEKIEALSKVVPRQKVYSEGKKVVLKLKEVIPPELFSVSLQAAVGGRIIARETIKPFRKDVTGHLYGGDYSRKKKLLEKQKKGKKKMEKMGRVNIPPEAFLKILGD